MIALRTLFQVTVMRPCFHAHGGGNAEDLALQHIQVHLRIVIAYFFAQLLGCAVPRAGCSCLAVQTSTGGDSVLIVFAVDAEVGYSSA